MNMNWQCVCFDLDNTLLDYELAFEKGMLYSFDYFSDEKWDLSHRIDSKDWFQVFKKYCDDLYTEVELNHCSKIDYRRNRFLYTMKEFQKGFTAEEADEFQQFFYSCVHKFVEPYEGVFTLLNWLKAKKLKLGLITNGSYTIQMQKIKKIGLDQWFNEDSIFISEDVGVEKPKYEIFHQAKAQLAPSLDSKDMLFIGDSWELDVVGSIEAGWEAIYINTRQEKPSTEHEPFAICDTFNEVTEIILSNNK